MDDKVNAIKTTLYYDKETNAIHICDLSGNEIAKFDANGLSAAAINVLKDGSLVDVLELINSIPIASILSIYEDRLDALYITDGQGYVFLKLSADGLEYYGQADSSLPLDGFELFSLGDSLSAGGVWQGEVARVTGCAFDQTKNTKSGSMLSVGGTTSFGKGFDNMLWRAYNLVEEGYIEDAGESSIIVLENVNDGAREFDGSVRTIIPTTPIEGYNYSDWGGSLPAAIPSGQRILNACLRLNKTQSGKKLTITSLPTNAGTVTIKAGWSGTGGARDYNIEVTASETHESLIAKILEYDYTGLTDTANNDGYSVDFAVTDNPAYTPTIQFVDTGTTGMACSVTDTDSAQSSVAMYFIGDSVADWEDTTKWQEGITYSQGWKSTIELLQRNYPKAHIFVSLFPLHAVTQANYLLPSGAYDTASYNQSERMGWMRTMEVQLGAIAKFYSLAFINVFALCGIGISNMTEFYQATANVHPKNTGYVRFGDTVATELLNHLNKRTI